MFEISPVLEMYRFNMTSQMVIFLSIVVLCVLCPTTVASSRTERMRKRANIRWLPDTRARQDEKRFVNDAYLPDNDEGELDNGTRDDDVIWVDRGPGSRGYKGGDSSHPRVSRQTANSQNQIELLLIVDNKAFSGYLTRNGNNIQGAMAEVTRYYAGIMNSVNSRFQKLDAGGFSVRAVLSRLLIMTAPSTLVTSGQDSNGDGRIDAYATLDAMEDLSRRVQFIYPHDFLLLMTGYDLYTPRGTNIVGITYGDGICSNERIGLVEDDGDEQMAATVTHELSHSIGAGHDRQDNSCPDSFYIMAPSTGIPSLRSQSFNPFTFSECSKREIRSFLANSYTSCLRSRKTLPGSEVNVPALTFVPLGQQYSADQQCINTYGSGSRFCREQYNRADFTFTDMCYRLRCRVPGRSGCTSTLPFFGTSCGNRRWCQDGSCVFNTRAPPVISPTCPQGDDITAQCSLNLCPILSFGQYRCCGTCARLFREPTLAPTAAPTVAPTAAPTGAPPAAPTQPADVGNTMSVVGGGAVQDGGSVTMSFVGGDGNAAATMSVVQDAK